MYGTEEEKEVEKTISRMRKKFAFPLPIIGQV